MKSDLRERNTLSDAASEEETAVYWLIESRISSGDGDIYEILMLDGSHGESGDVLPLFSFEDEARLYLKYGMQAGESASWTVAGCSQDQVERFLVDQGAQADYVALDPFPELTQNSNLLELTTIRREAFMEGFIGSGS